MVVRRCKVHGPKTGLNHLLLNAMQNYFYFFVFTLQKGKYFYILLNKSKNNAESAGLLCFRPHPRPLSRGEGIVEVRELLGKMALGRFPDFSLLFDFFSGAGTLTGVKNSEYIIQ